METQLVGDWNMTGQLGLIIIPTDELIFFRGLGIPPSRQMMHDFTSMVMNNYAKNNKSHRLN